MNYFIKYLKYKKKYLDLKHYGGGGKDGEHLTEKQAVEEPKQAVEEPNFFEMLESSNKEDIFINLIEGTLTEDEKKILQDNNINLELINIPGTSHKFTNSRLLTLALASTGPISDRFMNVSDYISRMSAKSTKFREDGFFKWLFNDNEISLPTGGKNVNNNAWIDVCTTIFYIILEWMVLDKSFWFFMTEDILTGKEEDYLLKLTNLIFKLIKITGLSTLNGGIREFTNLVNLFKYFGITRFDIVCPPEEHNPFLMEAIRDKGIDKFYGCGRCVYYATSTSKIIFYRTTTSDDNCIPIK